MKKYIINYLKTIAFLLSYNLFVLAQQTQNIYITFVQRQPNAGPTLYKWYTNVLCLLGGRLEDT